MRMKIFHTACVALTVLMTLVAAGPSYAANNAPIILVHGFLGYGRTEMDGYKYWGGEVDLQTVLAAQYTNQQIYTVAIGPVSSSWERAVEIFYQIKGGCVDYGAAHSKTYGILEKPEIYYHNGRTCYPGFYPKWDAHHPIHLISHSMGGQDSKMLVQMLASNGAPLNPGLFPYSTSAAWVTSVTTISTPNDGTTLAYDIQNTLGFINEYIAGLAIAAEVDGNSINNLLDFKLDQWKITPKQPNETFFGYVARVESSKLFQNYTRDFSTFDLSPQGAMIENSWVKDQPGVTYFSLATNSTSVNSKNGHSVALSTTEWYLSPFANSMGDYSPSVLTVFPYSASSKLLPTWWPNDGAVPTVSMTAPTWTVDSFGFTSSRGTKIRDLSNAGAFDLTNSVTSVKGAWNYLGLMAGLDHLAIIGHDGSTNLVPIYTALVNRVRSL